MPPVTRSARGRAAAPTARVLDVSRVLPNDGSIRRLSTEVAVPLNMNNGVRTGGETGNAATNNMENENTPEVEEELNDSVQFVDVLNNITGNSEVVLEEVVYITDSETEEDSIASRENLNVALNPVLVDLSGNESSTNVPNVSSEVVDLTDSPSPAPAPVPASPAIESGLGCPICLESVAGVKRTGASMVSTVCGHIFCSACLPNSIKVSGGCPTCRRPLSINLGWHKIFI